MTVNVANATDLSAAPRVEVTDQGEPEGLLVEDLVVGEGREAAATNTVAVQYVGVHAEGGAEFDSSWGRGGQPVTFPLSGVIAGFRDGIAGMREGGRRILVMPPAMGYGTRGAPPAIGPDETLVFVVDLVGVR